jgi:uncharacterized membrane protein YfcA
MLDQRPYSGMNWAIRANSSAPTACFPAFSVAGAAPDNRPVVLDYVVAAAAAIVAGAVGSMTGFGIGSLLTPVLALSVDTRLAVAAVAIPHVVGTAVRFRLMQGRIDRKVLVSFGLTSAAGGLAGAALHATVANRWLDAVFGCLLLFAAVSEMSGLATHLRFRGWIAWVAGALSGLLGGLVGNQGGIRSAALTGFNLPKEQFVATATAIALFVDGARLPIYLASQHEEMRDLWRWIVVASIGVTAGTLAGSRALARVPEIWFQRILGITLATLGALMLSRAFRP